MGKKSNGPSRPGDHAKAALFVVQAGRQHGLGHLMRCRALAQAWQRRGGAVEWLLPSGLEHMVRDISEAIVHGYTPESRDNSASIIAPKKINNFLKNRPYQWLVLDGYGFDDSFQSQLSLNSARLLVLDDFGHGTHAGADLLITPGWAIPDLAQKETGNQSPDRWLAGPEYVLIRDEFRSLSPASFGVSNVGRTRWQRIVITVGGSDPGNDSARVLEQVIRHAPTSWAIDVVLGPCNPHRAPLASIARSARHDIRLVTSGRDIAGRLAGAALAITSASTTTFELAYLNVPFLAVQTAANQDRMAAALRDLDDGLVWGHKDIASGEFAAAIRHLTTQRSARENLQIQLRGLVDGQGPERIVRRMNTVDFRLRKATPSDAHTVWAWRNNPEVRAVSFQTAPIAWPEHESWYQRRLVDPACEILILTDPQGQDVGQVRLERNPTGTEFVLSICMAPGMRGRGLGTALIESVCRRIRRREGHAAIRAIIKPANTASQTAFRKAGFVPVASTTVRNQVALQFQWPATTALAHPKDGSDRETDLGQTGNMKRAG